MKGTYSKDASRGSGGEKGGGKGGSGGGNGKGRIFNNSAITFSCNTPVKI